MSVTYAYLEGFECLPSDIIGNFGAAEVLDKYLSQLKASKAINSNLPCQPTYWSALVNGWGCGVMTIMSFQIQIKIQLPLTGGAIEINSKYYTIDCY
jgi:hypothetical protein